VPASAGKQVIDRKVGDSVELSSNLPTEGVSRASWRYGNSVLAVQGSGVTANNPFQGRVEFNDVSFSLTVRELTLQDSEDFSFLSEANGQQRPTVIITLQVHELIPDLNGSCTVYLECRAAPHRNTNYILTVGNQTHEGPKLHYHITPQDGDTTVTCNASNAVSEMSASETLRCRNTDSLSNKGMFRNMNPCGSMNTLCLTCW
uniref:Immunoglobulin subtype domain-containing protein n=1 Tax=Cyprinodon variegatus TaxID=28743 RepID=A0A3Q2FUV9_CYPVA